MLREVFKGGADDARMRPVWSAVGGCLRGPTNGAHVGTLGRLDNNCFADLDLRQHGLVDHAARQHGFAVLSSFVLHFD